MQDNTEQVKARSRSFLRATIGFTLIVLTGCASSNSGPSGRPPEVSPMKAAFWPPYPDEPRVQFLTSYLNSKEIEPARSKLDDLVYGKEKQEAQNVNKPYGVRMWNGRIYVCDIRANCVVIFDLRKHQTLLMGKSGSEVLQTPTDLAIAEDGYKYVTDVGRGLVIVFDGSDRSVNVIGHKDMKPVAAAVYKDELYVAETVGKRVEVYNRHTGQLLRTVGEAGTNVGQFVLPISVAVDKEGNLYVMDVMTTRLTKFDRAGKPVIGYFGTITAAVGGLVRPKHISVDNNGIIYVVDAAFQNVQLFDQKGQVLTFFGSPGNHPGAMYLPAGICVYDGDMDLFKEYVHPAFQPEHLIVVTNQFGPRRVAIYAFGHLKPGKTARDISASRDVIATGLTDKTSPNTTTELPATQPATQSAAPQAVPDLPQAPTTTPNTNIPGSAIPGGTSDAVKK
jgi:hypothetical protein